MPDYDMEKNFYKSAQLKRERLNFVQFIIVLLYSGSCVGGVVGSKMPHFSVFGDTVITNIIFVTRRLLFGDTKIPKTFVDAAMTP